MRAAEDKRAILANLQKLEKWGALTPENIAKMKKGNRPATGAGEPLAVDHVLPIARVPELAARFFNLEIILAKENAATYAKVGTLEMGLAQRWHVQGLLSAAGLDSLKLP